jgi:ABC-2 type transport system ATP-binding protein
VRVGGVDVAEDPERAQASIGYLPESGALYGDMRVEEYLGYRARLKGVARGAAGRAVDAAMARVGVGDARRRTIAELSKGWRQRVGLADALVADPPVLVLDEPSAGLDPLQLRELREIVRELGRERAVLISSHALTEVQATASRVVILVNGRVVSELAVGELRAGERTLEDAFVEALR